VLDLMNPIRFEAALSERMTGPCFVVRWTEFMGERAIELDDNAARLRTGGEIGHDKPIAGRENNWHRGACARSG
jgi:hypothetical protein